MRARLQSTQRLIERQTMPDFTAACDPGSPRGNSRINLDEHGAGGSDRIERPHWNCTGQSIENPHASQAGFANLGCANQVETTLRRAIAAFAAALLCASKGTGGSGKPVTPSTVAAAKMPAGLRMINKG